MGQSLVTLNEQDIIDRVATGERLIDIANSYGFKTHAVISKHLADNPEYQAAREIALEVRMDTREDELELANDNVTVARARELLSHARWRAERECPSRWGKVAEAQAVSVTLNLSSSTLARADDLLKTAPVTIDQEGEG